MAESGPPCITVADERCTRCGACVERCVSGALLWTGLSYSDETLLRIIMEDEPYYRVSGGGVTFSGGEPLLHPRYIGRIAKELHKQNIAVLIETCGHFNYSEFERHVLPYIRDIYFDIKLIEPHIHREYTQHDNTLILENFSRLAVSGVRVTPRTPMIPGITDTEDNLRKIAEFLKRYNMENQHIRLPFNRI